MFLEAPTCHLCIVPRRTTTHNERESQQRQDTTMTTTCSHRPAKKRLAFTSHAMPHPVLPLSHTHTSPPWRPCNNDVPMRPRVAQSWRTACHGCWLGEQGFRQTSRQTNIGAREPFVNPAWSVRRCLPLPGPVMGVPSGGDLDLFGQHWLSSVGLGQVSLPL